jgi:hypothetical protein
MPIIQTTCRLHWIIGWYRCSSLLGNNAVWSSALKMEAVCFSETLVSTYKSTQSYYSEDQYLYRMRTSNLRILNWKWHARKRSPPNLRHCPDICLEGLKITTNLNEASRSPGRYLNPDIREYSGVLITWPRHFYRLRHPAFTQKMTVEVSIRQRKQERANTRSQLLDLWCWHTQHLLIILNTVIIVNILGYSSWA